MLCSQNKSQIPQLLKLGVVGVHRDVTNDQSVTSSELVISIYDNFCNDFDIYPIPRGRTNYYGRRGKEVARHHCHLGIWSTFFTSTPPGYCMSVIRKSSSSRLAMVLSCRLQSGFLRDISSGGARREMHGVN
jgi:hypothetical protein